MEAANNNRHGDIDDGLIDWPSDVSEAGFGQNDEEVTGRWKRAVSTEDTAQGDWVAANELPDNTSYMVGFGDMDIEVAEDWPGVNGEVGLGERARYEGIIRNEDMSMMMEGGTAIKEEDLDTCCIQ